MRESGTADHAAQVLERICEHVTDVNELAAAGIDSPLFWVANGDRRADQTIRLAMKAVGATNVDGTVQRVNSLRGACLVQGLMAAHLLRRDIPSIRLTESHPKALLWLVKIANRERRVADITIEHLAHLIECEMQTLSEHQRDAALGAVAASAMLSKIAGWRDLAEDEYGAFAPVSPVEYWMPVGKFPA